MTYNIFISYSTKDLEEAKKIKDLISQIPDARSFLAETNLLVGSLSQSIITAIQECDLFVVLHSRNSQDSSYVQQEIGAARMSNKLIIPILLDPGARPEAMIQENGYLAFYDPTKKHEEMMKLYNYILKNSKQKANNQVILGLAVLFVLAGIASRK
jgi:hypothetical protein